MKLNTTAKEVRKIRSMLEDEGLRSDDWHCRAASDLALLHKLKPLLDEWYEALSAPVTQGYFKRFNEAEDALAALLEANQ